MIDVEPIIIIKGKVANNFSTIKFNSKTKGYDVKYNKSKTIYSYSKDNIEFLKDAESFDFSPYYIKEKNGKFLRNITSAYIFNNKALLLYFGKRYKAYLINDLVISKDKITFPSDLKLKDYYLEIAEDYFNETGNLSDQYRKMNDIKNTVLEKFLEPNFVEIKPKKKIKNIEPPTIIYPFCCNLSQMEAIEKALNNKISIIQGPPGTGKTQTILNCIANIVLRNQTVAVVSNNNSATDNVFEKLQKGDYSYICAQLGNLNNKTRFFNSEIESYPDFQKYIINEQSSKNLMNIIQSSQEKIKNMLAIQNRIAILKNELDATILEKKYFNEVFKNYKKFDIFRKNIQISIKTIHKIWIKFEELNEYEKRMSFFEKLIYILFYRIKSFSVFKESYGEIVLNLQYLFYESKIDEIKNEIKNLENELYLFDFEKTLNKLNFLSNEMFKMKLADKYYKNESRNKFDKDTLQTDSRKFLKEFPVILSTTHSLRNSIYDMKYDYVIVDEASQVDLVTGVLAMSCAKNIIIVGDLKQLPNVIKDELKKELNEISNEYNVKEAYRVERQSLLSSALKIFDNIPKTLLKEHYRCHPKIINFCNKKFYDNKLVIMTQDNNEADVLKVYMTQKGNHARGRYNQRQIDEIVNVILPELNSDDVGIISPYNDQKDELILQLKKQLDISTVHKFQGREKKDIIISTVDNKISDFTDDPNLLNVAVSRAKNRLRLVVSDNEENRNTNIGDLIRYIRYNNCEIQKSEISSIFDLLYKTHTEEKRKYLKDKTKISKWDSENIAYATIQEVLTQDKFSKLKIRHNIPLNTIIKDFSKLNYKEEKFARNPYAHVDFVIYSDIEKKLILAVEVDGYKGHNEDVQKRRDLIKNSILEKYSIPLLRLSTVESLEEEKLNKKLNELMGS